MDNTNRKCIFGNDLLLGTQSNVGFPAAVAVGFFGHKLNVPYNCPFIHNVYLPCTSHKVLSNHNAVFDLTSLSRRNVFPVTFHLLIPLFC